MRTRLNQLAIVCCAVIVALLYIPSATAQITDPGLIGFDEFLCSPVAPEPESCCENGFKPQKILMRYTGQDCSATSTTQPSDKWNCSGDPASDPEVYIIANNNNDPNSGDIWFEGTVSLNGTYLIDATYGGATKLNSNTVVHIFDQQGGSIIQTVNFHTSCSQPLATGDQWGANKILFMIGEMGEECGNTNTFSTIVTVFPAVGSSGCMSSQSCCPEIGKPAQMSMKYTGESCAATSTTQPSDKWSCTGDPAFDPEVYIISNDNSNPASGKIWFTGTVNLNGMFVIDAANGGEPDLSSNTWVHIFDQQGGTLLQSVRFHTSCSQPLITGEQWGSIMLYYIVGTNSNCGNNPMNINYLWEKRTVTAELWTLIPGETGENLDPGFITETTQFRRLVLDCTTGDTLVTNVVTKTVYPGVTVELGDDINICVGDSATLTATAIGGTPPYTFSWNQGLGSGSTHVVYPATTTYYAVTLTDANGCEDIDSVCVVVSDKVTDPGEIGVDEFLCGPFENLTPESCCDNGLKPKKLLMLYTGEDCSATNTTQPSDKWNCAGDPAFDNEVYIIANDNNDPSSGNIWFSGVVTLNGAYLIDATNAGATKLASNTVVHIFDQQGGTVIQTVNFHTSCSQPLAIGDQWGASKLLHIEGEMGDECGTSSSGFSTIVTVFPALGSSECLVEESCCETTGKAATLTMKYTGESCAATNSTQTSWTCDGDPASDPMVYIVANDNSDPNSGRIWFSGDVSINETFVLDATNGGEPDLENTTYVHIFDQQGGTVLQTVSFHTSCSQPLITGEQWGAAQLVHILGVTGYECGNDPSEISYLWQKRTDTTGAWMVIPGETGENLDPGIILETTQFRRLALNCACGDTLYTNIVTKTVYPSVMVEAGEDATICVGVDSAVLTATASGGTPPYTFEWNQGLGFGSTHTVFPDSTTYYTVTLTDANECQDVDSVCVIVSETVSDPGEIGYDEFFCDPGIDSVSCCENGFKPAKLLMLYTGEDCDATNTSQSSDKWNCTGDPAFDNEVYIIANNNNDPNGGDIWFAGVVPLNGTYLIDAANGGATRLNSNTVVHIFDHQGGSIIQTVNFHTSCSQPLATGDQWGANQVIYMEGEMGEICGNGSSFSTIVSVSPAIGSSGCVVEESCCGTTGKPVQLTMQYTGESCAATNTTQGSWSCDGDPASDPMVYIIANDNSDPNSGRIWFAGGVSLYGTYTLDATNAGEADLTSTTWIHIFDAQGGTVLQSVSFHTSCSQPLVTGEQWGANQLVHILGVTGNECGNDPTSIEYVWEKRSGTTGPWTIIPGENGESLDPGLLLDDTTQFRRLALNCVCGDTLSSNIVTKIIYEKPEVDAGADTVICIGESVTIMANATGGTPPYTFVWNQGLGSGSTHTVSPIVTTYYSVTLTDANGCQDMDSVCVIVNQTEPDGGEIGFDEENCGPFNPDTIVNIIPGSDGDCNLGETCCESGFKPAQITMRYTGEDCSASSNSQPPDKWSCSGDPAYDSEVYIIANDKSNPNDGCIWFSGTVTLGNTYVIDAANALETRLSSNTWIHIFDMQGGTVIQTVNFHTSCSQPLSTGDQYGANLLLHIVAENGTTCGDADPLIEYQWQFRTDTTAAWVDIPGATSESYDPPFITETTYYRRLTINCICSGEVTSNIVIKEVNENPDVMITIDAQESCVGNDGALTANPSGGEPPYMYKWSTGDTTQSITGLTAGTYFVVVVDANGCLGKDTVNIEKLCFDLALRKTVISSGPYLFGSTVTFQIEVINQGTLDATNVEITDYIPVGLTLDDASWTKAGNLATQVIPGPITANGGTATLSISFEVNANVQGDTIVNYAEISDADNPLNLPDFDSTPDQDNTNDAGGKPNSTADDYIDGNGTGTPGDGVAATDEDDHDPALITVELAMLGDIVWEDLDADGIQDNVNQPGGEPGIANVTVKLITAGPDGIFGTPDDVIEQTLITADGSNAFDYDNDGNPDPVGFFKFNGLIPGVEYKVMFNNPDPDGDDAYMFSPRQVDGDPDSGVNSDGPMSDVIVLSSGEYNETIDAGLFRKGSIHVFGYLDDNGDGIQDSSDVAFPDDPGKRFELLDTSGNVIAFDTTMDGMVWFVGLVPGTYTVRENPIPDDYDLTTLPNERTFTIISGEEVVYEDGAAMLDSADQRFETNLGDSLKWGNTELAMLGDIVWEDLDADGIQDNINQPGGEPGIAGVTVKLITAGPDGIFGTPDDVIEQTLITGDGSNTDYDGDGNPDPVGFYKFNGLMPGVEYKVMFNNPDPDGDDAYMFSPRQVDGDPDSGVNSDGPMSDVVVLGSGEYNETIDAGLFRKGSIHIFGYLDDNGDGIQDSSDVAFPDDPGKRFELLDSSGNVIDFDTTMDGMVWFVGLTPGTYTVRENPVPDDYLLTTLPNERTFTIISGEEVVYEDGAAMLDSTDQRFETNLGDSLRWGNTELAMLGDIVWEDLDADGIQDNVNQPGGEPGIANVTVKLITAGPDGIFGTPDDVVEQTLLTGDGSNTDYDGDGNPDPAGFYKFNNLIPGVEYKIMFNNPDPDGDDAYMFSPRQVDGDPDSGVNSDGPMSDVIVLSSGEYNETIDAGLFRKGSIHVFGYLDNDGDGNQDSSDVAFPDDPGKRFELLDSSGNVIAFDTTMDGMVWFVGLLPGTYTVRENPIPDDYDLTTLPNERTFTIISGEELVYEDGAAMLDSADQRFETNLGDELKWGNTQLAMLGDIVWEDLDADGIQDNINQPGGEPGIAGVTVKLITAGPDDIFGTPDDVIEQTLITGDGSNTDYDGDGNPDPVGFYKFNGLMPGVEYKVMFNNPDPDGDDAYMFSQRQVDGDPDSGVNSDGPMSDVVVLGSGEYNETIDAGLFRKGSIHIFGYLDDNGDGIQDSSDVAFPDDPGKRFELLDSSGNVIDFDTTMDGMVWFVGLTPGTYTVRENPVPDDYLLTTLPNERTFTIISGEEVVYEDGAAMLDSTDQRFETNLGDSLRWGNTELAMLGDIVWEDLDADGIQDNVNQPGGEPGIANVTVKLITAGPDGIFGTPDDVVEQTLLTGDGSNTDYDGDGNPDPAGFYKFNNLIPGVEYKVMFNNPDPDGDDAYMFSPRQVDGDPDSGVNSDGPMSDVIVLSSGEYNETIDAGLFRKGSIHVFGYLDNDGDGNQDSSDVAFPDDPGKRFELLDSSGNVIAFDTTMDGMVWFVGLVPGTYTVRENPIPDDYDLTTLPNERTFTIISGEELVYEDGAAMLDSADQRFETNLGDELKWGNTQLAMLGDIVWEDLDADGIQDNINEPGGEPGIAGVTVKLLTAGPDGVFGTADDVIEQTLLTGDGSNTDYDGDGIADPAGFYKFNGLMPGVEYKVMFNNPDPDGDDAYMFSPRQVDGDPDSGVNSDGPMSDVVVLGSGEYNETIDAGLFRKGSIHIFGYLDDNGDGIQDSSDIAFPDDPGKRFELLDSSGNVIDFDTTMDGMVWFVGLTPGTYTVRENPVPDDYLLTTLPNERTFTIISGEEVVYEDGAAMLDSTDQRFETNLGDSLRWGNTELAMLGDIVWEDLDADGIQDNVNQPGGEPGIANVTVKLITAGPDGIFGTPDDVIEQTLLTGDGSNTDYDGDGNPDPAGFYKFNNLIPGVEYKIMFNNPDPDGDDAYMFSPRQVDGDPDSGVNSDGPMSDVIVLSSGEYNETIDAGLFRKGSIHVFGYLDNNGDGNQDSSDVAFPDDPGKRFELLDSSGNVIAFDTTMDGMVWFVGLVPGTYTVRENPIPDDYDLTTLPNERTFTIISGEELVYEDGAAMLDSADQRFETNLGDELKWGNTQLAMLGDIVWEDLDADGIQDNINEPGGEPGIAGVTVKLLTAGPDGVFGTADDVIEQTLLTGDGSNTDYDGDGIADPAGFYKFNGLMPGVEYKVMFNNPDPDGDDAYMFSPRQVDGDPDSGVNSDGPMSDVVVLGSGEYNETIDAGLFRKGSIHIFGYLDDNGDGIQDSSDVAFPDDPGKRFELLDSSGNVIDFDTTMDGMVWFVGLTPGTYTVRENPVPDDYLLTTLPNERTFTIISGEEVVYEDGAAMLDSTDQRFETNLGDSLRWGNTELAMLGDIVWEDLDADGIQDNVNQPGGEPGIANVTVKLITAGPDGIFGTPDDVIEQTLLTGDGSNTDYDGDGIADPAGFYKFNNLIPGVEYKVMFNNPDPDGDDAYMFSPRQVDGDPDSGVNSDGPMSDVIVLSSGEYNETIDAGLFRKGSIHVFGYLDNDGDGNQDSSDVAFPDDPGKRFELLDSSGNIIAFDTTMDGMVWFVGLTPGTYQVRENPIPENYELSTLPNTRTFTIISGEEVVYEDGAAMLDSADHRFETNLGDSLKWGNTFARFFDLALRKTESSSGPYSQGSFVTFQIQVINQGNVDATDVEVTDYIPTGLNLADGAWAQAGNLATRTIAGPIVANGGLATVTITFQIDANFQGTTLVNYAEISDFENEFNLPDEDSTPDQDNTNDAGGQPNSPADDYIDGDGTGTPGDGVAATDEDDHDPALINVVQDFDLALRKFMINGLGYTQGNTVTFTIQITNQGSLDATNVEITDYIPSGLTLTDAAWAQAGNLATRTIAGPIAANGGTATVTISFLVNTDAPCCGTIVNYAEISDFENAFNLPDADSSPDQDNTNDAGGQPQSPADNFINGDGTGTPGDGVAATDEDDHDSELINTFDDQPPVLTCAPDDHLGCNPATLPGPATLTGVDNCQGSVPAFPSVVQDDTVGCIGTLKYKYTAMDTCGNTATCIQTITYVVDNDAPVFDTPNDDDLGCNPTVLPGPEQITAIDNCLGSVAVTSAKVQDDTSGCIGTLVYKYTAMDTCDNVSTGFQTITYVVDNEAPQFDCPPGGNLGCNPDLEDPMELTAVDNCLGVIPVTSSVLQNDTFGCIGILTYKYTAADTCGNMTMCTQSFTYTVDTVPPTIVDCPNGGDLGCNPASLPLPDLNAFLVEDNCAGSGTLLLKRVDTLVYDTTDCLGALTYRYTAEDFCGNISTCYQAYTYAVDHEAPQFDCPPGDDLGCNPASLPGPEQFTALDNCLGVVNVSSSTVQDDTVGCVGTLIYKYSASDSCDNVSTCFQTYTYVVDNEGPVFDCPPGGNLGCNPASLPGPNQPTAFDNCLGSVPVASSIVLDDTTGCVGILIYKYSAMDTCGNATTCFQTYAYVVDNEAPQFECPPGDDLGCNPPTLPAPAQLSADDNCLGGLPVQVMTTQDDTVGCVGTLTYKYSAADTCGNITTCFQTFTYTVDNDAPVFDCPPGDHLGCNPASLPAPQQLIANDNCLGSIPVAVNTVQDDTVGCTGTLTYKYSVSDNCGNVLTCFQTFTYAVDNDAPVFDCPPGDDLGCNPTSLPGPAQPAGFDNCLGTVPVVATTIQDDTSGCVGTLIYKYAAQDTCGNVSTCFQTFTYVVDNEGPVFDCPQGGDLGCNPDIDDPVQLTAEDACIGVVQVTGEVLLSDTLGCDGILIYKFTATDTCGNMTMCTQTYTYTVDTTAPNVIVCPTGTDLGCNPAVLPQPNLNGFAVSDNCAGSGVEPVKSVDTLVNDTTNCLGVLTYRYSAEDFCGNVVTCLQTFTYTVDNEGPQFDCPQGDDLGCNPVTLPGPDQLNATDSCIGSVPVTVITVHDDTVFCVGTLTYKYTAADACGNTTTCFQTYTYFVDHIGPYFDCPPGDDLGCNPDTLPDPVQIIASDNCMGMMSIVVFPSVVLDDTSGCAGVLTYKYSATDICGNVTTCFQTYTYTVDDEAPVFDCPPGDDLGCNPAALPGPASPSAVDDCSGGVPVIATTVQDDTVGCVGTLIYKYSASDACGRVSTCFQTFTYVVDNEGPVFDCPQGGDLGCNPDIDDPVQLTAVDACVGTVPVTGEVLFSDTTGCDGILVYKFSAADTCGNVTTCTQTFTYIVDNTPPNVILCPQGGDLGCNPDTLPDPNVALFIVSDNCAGSGVDPAKSVDTLANDTTNCQGVLTYRYSAEDFCGNVSTCIQTYTYTVDNEAPQFDCPAGGDLGCNPAFPGPSTVPVNDNCDGTSTITGFLVNADTTNCVATVVYSYTASDACGNETSCSQVFTYRADTEDPVITCLPNLTLECGDSTDLANSTPTVTDNCGDVETLSHVDVVTGGQCPVIQTIIRTWTATDSCGNVASCVQTISIVDAEGPVFEDCPDDALLGCGDKLCLDFDALSPGEFVTSITAGSITVDISAYAFGGFPADARIFNSSAPTPADLDLGTPNKYYGGPGVSNSPGGFELTNNRSLGNLLIIQQTGITEPNDHAFGDSLVFDFSESVFVGCLTLVDIENPSQDGEILAYNADGQLIGDVFAIPNIGDNSEEDLCVNKAGVKKLVVRFDGSGAVDDICFYSLEKPEVTAFDVCEQAPADVTCEEQFNINSIGDCTILTISRTWSATDTCGNVSTCTQTVTITTDFEAPEIVCPDNVEISCGDPVPPVNTAGVIAFDNCSDQGDITIAFVEDIVTGTCPTSHTIRRVYSATDTCGNSALCAQIISVTGIPPMAAINAKVLLGSVVTPQPEYMENMEMDANLDIPFNQPYSEPPFNYSGSESCGTPSANVIDWILLELREAGNPSNIIAQKCGLLMNTGQIVDVDEVGPVVFDVPVGFYHLAIRHRNHLGIMTSQPLDLMYISSFDFSTADVSEIYMGANAIQVVNNSNVMIAGNVNQDALVNNTDLFVLAPTASIGVEGAYDPKDVNLDGLINNTDLFILAPIASTGYTEALPENQ